MSLNSFPDWTLCPVCREQYVDPRTTYCSSDCLNEAKRYRRRMDNVVQGLRSFGFTAKFINGIQLELTMPEFMREFYPRRSWTYHFPTFLGSTTAYRASDLTAALRFWLGPDVFKLTAILEPCKGRIPFKLTDKIHVEPVIEAVVPIEQFICNDCTHLYVRSNETFIADHNICCECEIKRIPF